MRVAGHGAHWANKVGPPRVMTGFARGPALIAFYLFLIFCTPHRDAYMNGWIDRRTDVSQEGTSGPKGPPCRLPSLRFISLIGARDRLTANRCDSSRFTSRSLVELFHSSLFSWMNGSIVVLSCGLLTFWLLNSMIVISLNQRKKQKRL